jgi:hypothetical protein
VLNYVEGKGAVLNADPRVQKCLLTYAKATREGGHTKNEQFETTNPAAKKFLEEYDKKLGNAAGEAPPEDDAP